MFLLLLLLLFARLCVRAAAACSGSPANQTDAAGFSCSNNTFGAVCSVACANGFSGAGYNSTCGASGWSTPVGSCSATSEWQLSCVVCCTACAVPPAALHSMCRAAGSPHNTTDMPHVCVS